MKEIAVERGDIRIIVLADIYEVKEDELNKAFSTGSV